MDWEMGEHQESTRKSGEWTEIHSCVHETTFAQKKKMKKGARQNVGTEKRKGPCDKRNTDHGVRTEERKKRKAKRGRPYRGVTNFRKKTSWGTEDPRKRGIPLSSNQNTGT